MTNTTELRKRWEAFSPFKSNVADLMKKRKEEDARDLAHCIRENTIDFIQSEIEAAEKAKVEEVITYVENAPHRVKGYEYGEKLCKDTRNRFLTKPNDEN